MFILRNIDGYTANPIFPWFSHNVLFFKYIHKWPPLILRGVEEPGSPHGNITQPANRLQGTTLQQSESPTELRECTNMVGGEWKTPRVLIPAVSGVRAYKSAVVSKSR